MLSVTTFNYKRKGVGSLAPGKGGRKLTKNLSYNAFTKSVTKDSCRFILKTMYLVIECVPQPQPSDT